MITDCDRFISMNVMQTSVVSHYRATQHSSCVLREILECMCCIIEWM